MVVQLFDLQRLRSYRGRRAIFYGLLLLGTFAPLPAAPAPKPMRAIFLAPAESKENPFWKSVDEHMRAAAQSLGIQFSFIVAKPWVGDRGNQVRQLLSGPDRPDFFITTAHMGVGTSELEIAEQAGVKTFMIDAGLLEKDLKRVGGPRQTFRLWIGQMIPSGEKAGHDEAQALLEGARARTTARPIEILALGGCETDLTAIERAEGLRRAVAEAKDAVLKQIITCNWDPEQARNKVPLMVKRYPGVAAVWSANDAMALGAMTALRAQGKVPGKDVLVGGIDWDPACIEAVGRGEMEVDVGGHFLDGAWALVLLYDYHQGVDFADEALQWHTSMLPVTRKNLATLGKYFHNRNLDRIDFKAFSRKCHPEQKRHRFTWDAFLEQHARSFREASP